MRFGLTQKILTFLLAAVSAVPLVFSGEVGVVPAAVFGVLLVVGWFLEPPLTSDKRYRVGALVIMLLLLLAQAAFVVTGKPVARAALEFAILLLGIKLSSRSRFADYQQIVILAFLLIIGATVTTLDISYAVCFVLFVILCPSVLALAHLRNEMERRFRHDDGGEGQEALGRLLASRRVISGRFIAGTGLLALPVLVITLVLFVGFPRFGLGFFGSLSASRVMAGFSTEVKIGDITGERDRETIVLRLEPLSAEGRMGARLPLKIRGAVFDLYEEGVWRRTGKKRFEKMKRKGNDYHLGGGGKGSGPAYSVLLESMEPPFLFVPAGTSRITVEPVAKDGILKPRKLEINPLGIIRYEDRFKIGIRYEVVVGGAPLPGEGVDNPHYLSMPKGLEKVGELASREAGGGSDREKAYRIVRFLNTQYGYDDRVESNGDEDLAQGPLERFLFENQRGTCEHFATATVIMLRFVGIPARLITGFGSAEWNSVGDFYAVRTRSAHAWAEAYIDGKWVTLDATPPAPGGDRYEPPSRLSMLVDAVRMRWRKYVVGFDASNQVSMAKGLTSLVSKGDGGGQGGDIPWKQVALAFLGVLMVGILIWNRRRIIGLFASREGKRQPLRSESQKRVLDFYRSFESRMARLGCPRRKSRTPLEFLEDVARFNAGLLEPAKTITQTYNEVRFGGVALTDDGVNELRGAFSRLSSKVSFSE